MQTVALTAGEHAGLLVLLRAAEIETRQVGARVDEAPAHHNLLVALRDHFPDALLRVDDGVLLINVAHLDGLAYLEVAAVGLLQAHNEAEEGGFAGAVGPDDAHDAVGRQVEVEVLEKQFVAEGLAHVLGLDDDIAQTRSVGYKDLQRLFFFLDILVEELVVGVQTGFRLGVARFRGHTHPFQLSLEGLHTLALLLLLHRQAVGFLLQPGTIVALPGNALAAVEFENPAGHVVEEIAVVGHGDDGALVLLQVGLQPLHRLGVEVVGGLVQQEDVGFSEQQAAEGHAAPFASGEVLHRRVAVGAAQRIHRAFQFGVELPGVVLVDEFGEFALPLDELVHLVVAHRLSKFHIHLLVLLQHIHDLLHALLHHLLDSERVVELRLLWQITDGVAGREDHLALIGLVEAGDDLQQRGFSRAVEAQDADFRSVEEGKVDVLEDLSLRRNRLADVHHREYDFLVVCHCGVFL